jgi:hypothetical protein
MHSGSCLCGQIKFELLSDPKKVTSCHCSMCQKQHGAAFATYGSIPKNDLVYISGADKLISYNSSGSVERKFCGVCGSSLHWSGSKKFPDGFLLQYLHLILSLSLQRFQIYTKNHRFVG